MASSILFARDFRIYFRKTRLLLFVPGLAIIQGCRLSDRRLLMRSGTRKTVGPRLLFTGQSVFDVLENQKRRLRDELQRVAVSDLSDEELPQRLADEYGMRVPVLDEDRKYAKKRETQVDVSRDPMRFISDRSRALYMPGTELSILVPFSGDPGVFNVRPSAFDMNPPRGDVIGNELCFTYRFVSSPANLTSEYERAIGQVKKYLDWLRPSAAQLQSELLQLAQTVVTQRMKQAAEHAQILDSLGIPIRGDVPRAAPAEPPLVVPSHVTTRQRSKVRREKPSGWEVFICHASEDKEEIARPLANALDANGLSVWYDEFSLRVGDSLRQSIDHGLLRSKFGIVILSPQFFEKHWPQQELNGLATRELGKKKVILPIWHKVGFEEVRQYSPMLADRLAVSTDEGLEKVVQKIMEAMW
jgi:hypothetical protein